MRILAASMLVALAAALAGCLQSTSTTLAAPDEPRVPRPRIHAAAHPEPLAPDRVASSPVAFRIICDVLVIDAATGAVSQDADLWEHLKEDVIGAIQADHLRRNGFRVGVGEGADFAEVSRRILNTRDVKMSQGRMRFESRSAMELFVVSEVQPRRAFVYDREGMLSGDEYKPGVNITWVQAWHDVERVDAVNLTLTPEIRWGKAREPYYSPTLRRGNRYRDVGRLFDEVRVGHTLDRGQFLVLAPNVKAKPDSILGQTFMTVRSEGLRRERIILVRPHVERLPGI